MTRMKSLVIGAIATAMILGSSIVLATSPGETASTDTTVDQTNASLLELANPAPVKKGGGGSGRALKK